MFHYERLEKQTGVKIYFADAQSPRQRGTNGLLRQYFPNTTDLRTVNPDQVDTVAAELNNPPRRCLEDRTPNQLMEQWLKRQTIRNHH